MPFLIAVHALLGTGGLKAGSSMPGVLIPGSEEGELSFLYLGGFLIFSSFVFFSFIFFILSLRVSDRIPQNEFFIPNVKKRLDNYSACDKIKA